MIFAARTTSLQPTESISGSFIVYGMDLNNTTVANAIIVIQNKAADKDIMTFFVGANSSLNVDLYWLAEQGVLLTSVTAVTATIYHSQIGA